MTSGASGKIWTRFPKRSGRSNFITFTVRYLDDPGSNTVNLNRPRWPSPAYPGLIGNVLPEFLSYSYFPFPEPPRPHQPFPTLEETHEYLHKFAEPFLKNGTIRLNTEVVAVREVGEHAGWKVILKDWRGDIDGNFNISEEVWDGVVVANGWYDNPVWPETPGLEQLVELGLASHAISYRGPQEYSGKVRSIQFLRFNPTLNFRNLHSDA